MTQNGVPPNTTLDLWTGLLVQWIAAFSELFGKLFFWIFLILALFFKKTLISSAPQIPNC